jgi:hypothetical protein
LGVQRCSSSVLNHRTFAPESASESGIFPASSESGERLAMARGAPPARNNGLTGRNRIHRTDRAALDERQLARKRQSLTLRDERALSVLSFCPPAPHNTHARDSSICGRSNSRRRRSLLFVTHGHDGNSRSLVGYRGKFAPRGAIRTPPPAVATRASSIDCWGRGALAEGTGPVGTTTARGGRAVPGRTGDGRCDRAARCTADIFEHKPAALFSCSRFTDPHVVPPPPHAVLETQAAADVAAAAEMSRRPTRVRQGASRRLNHPSHPFTISHNAARDRAPAAVRAPRSQRCARLWRFPDPGVAS